MKVILFSTILIVGCAPSTPSIDESVPEPSPVGQRKMLTLDGDLEATKATKVMAPSADVYLGKYQRNVVAYQEACKRRPTGESGRDDFAL